MRLNRAWSVCFYFGVMIGTGLFGQLAGAGDWVFDHSTTLKLSHVDRTGRDSYSGQVAQATPNLHLHGEGGRFKADINYQPTISEGTGDTDPETLTHQLRGVAQLEAVKDVFFIGADASARLLGDSSSSASVDAINFNSEGGQQSYSLGITPELRHHINRYADLVSRNRFDWVTYSGNDNGSGSENSRSQTANLQINSGRHFSRFNWSLDATHRKTYYDSDRDDDTRKNYSANLGYSLSPIWAVNGSIGYEDNDVETDRSDTNGSTWDIGATWTPNPRTQASVEYGDRYFGERYAGRFSHRTRRTRFSADMSREVTNRREQQLVDSYFFLADANGNPILDPNGNPIVANIPQLQDIDGDYLNTQFRGAMAITGRRTTVTITGNVSNRDYEGSSLDEDSYGLTVSANRDLGSNYSANLTGRVEHVDGNTTNLDNDTYDVRFSLTKRLSPRTSTSLDLNYRDYNDDQPGESYTEKRIGLSFTTTYL